MAAKKSFKTEWNPAMQFISVPKPEQETPSIEEEKEEPEEMETPSSSEKRDAGSRSLGEKIEGPKAPKAPPEGYKANPLYVETKSRRLQLLMQPSLYEKVRDRAGADGLSVNEWIHGCLDEACR